MSKKNCNPTLIASAISSVSNFLNQLSSSTDEKERSKATLLSYWLKDYIEFIRFEKNFNPRKLIKYRRGDIIKVHLGFNIGSEEGGLHYAAVLENDNPISSPVVTIIPLTSIKPGKDVNQLRRGEVYCGNRIFVEMNNKIHNLNNQICTQINEEMAKLKKISVSGNDQHSIEATQQMINQQKARIEQLRELVHRLTKMNSEVSKMKVGSIALVNQITTISKIRIYDPKNCCDVLKGIRLSDTELNAIDAAIQDLYLFKKKSKNLLTN